MSDLLIRGGSVIDPANGLDRARVDVVIQNGRIARVAGGIDASGVEVLDATGLIVAPGFVDLHTHLREPGLEYKETIETGTRAAARGGFTTVCAMPNTEPAMDNRSIVDFVLRRAAEAGAVRVLPIGAVTKGRQGKLLAEMGELAEAGCIGFSDDGSPVGDAMIMRRALEYANGLGLPIIDHCEDPAMSGGVMHEGWVATRLGLKGIPAASEESAVARNIALARQAGAHVHIAHVSTAGAVDLVRRAKAAGVRITTEVTPHHLALTDERVMIALGVSALAYDTNAKMYPPLRAQADVEACLDGVADGTIDAIATDHAPHAIIDKASEFDSAAFGITGLETAFPLAWQAFQSRGLALSRLIEALTIGPVRALNLDRAVEGLGTLSTGASADLVLIDPERTWIVDPAQFSSKGKNTPLAGETLPGRIVATIYDGRHVYNLEGAHA